MTTTPYDKLAELFRQPTPNKIVTFMVNGGREEDYENLFQYLCEDLQRMHEMVALLNLVFNRTTSPELIGLLQKFHTWARSKYSRYRDMHLSVIRGDLERTRNIYEGMKTTLGDPLPPAITNIRRLNEIVQHFGL